MDKLAVGVLISGRGSNMEALARAATAADYPARIAVVIANRADAGGLAAAAAMGIPTEVVASRGRTREAFEAELLARLRARGVDLVCLAGFMRLLTPGFIAAWPDRLLNVHPSLLPAFRGLDTHARALTAGVKVHGCTVHLVRPELDEGPIVAQAAVAVEDDDTAETLAARVLAAEHRLYPLAVRWLAEGRLRVEGMRVRIGNSAPSPSLPPVAFPSPR